MGEMENKSLRSELFKEHTSVSGPFPVASFWYRVFGLLFPYLILMVISVVTGKTIMVFVLLPFISVLRPLVSVKLGGSLFESFVQLKVIDKKTLVNPTIGKFYLREMYIFVSIVVSSLLYIPFVLLIHSLATITDSMIGFDFLIGAGLVFFMGFPFLFVFFDHEEQSLFDKLAGLVVVSSAPYFKVQYPVSLLPVEENKYAGLLPFKFPF